MLTLTTLRDTLKTFIRDASMFVYVFRGMTWRRIPKCVFDSHGVNDVIGLVIEV